MRGELFLAFGNFTSFGMFLEFCFQLTGSSETRNFPRWRLSICHSCVFDFIHSCDMSNPNDSYYILKKEKIGKKKEKGILRTTSTKVDVLPGTLLCLLEEDTRENRLLWTLETVDSDSNHVEVQCYPNETGQLAYNEFRLLLPIPVCQERLSIYQDQGWLKEGANLHEGDRVLVSLKGYPDLAGTIRYKGELPSSKGIQFGVELAPVRTQTCFIMFVDLFHYLSLLSFSPAAVAQR